MSTELVYALSPSTLGARSEMRSIRSLRPAKPATAPAKQGRWSASTMVLVVSLHVALFYLALTHQVEPPAIETPETPMMVSLVEDPAPEIKAPAPTPPEPKPIVKKVTPEPKKPEPKPEPAPQEEQEQAESFEEREQRALWRKQFLQQRHARRKTE